MLRNAALCLCLLFSSTSGIYHVGAACLSIPQFDVKNATVRKAEITAVSLEISNQPRFHVVNGNAYPLPPGPIPLNGSLAQRIVLQELQLVTKNANPNLNVIFGQAAVANVSTLENYLPFYQSLEKQQLIAVPFTALDFSDLAFGEERLTVKGFRLRQVKAMIKPKLPLSPKQLNSLCGKGSIKDLIEKRRLFMEDYSFASNYNDKARPFKYVPSVKGYFCVNKKGQFRPLAIHVLDTKLVYTPYDSAQEWKLAKMALNSATVTVQAWDHFLQAHNVIEPIRVELLRSLSTSHPIYILMEHHFLQLFGNQILGLQVLLSANTTVDFVFGWGATGTLRFLYNESLTFHFTNQFFINQVQANGLGGIPNGRLFTDSQNNFNAIRSFVRDFVTLYYTPNQHGGKMRRPDPSKVIAADDELQNWFARSSKFVPGFPSKVTTVDGLVDTLTNLIFRTSVLHHAMNSDVLWHSVTFPYSLPGLFAPLPTKKGQTSINLKSFVIPNQLFAVFIAQLAAFLRPFSPDIALLRSYDSLAFNTTAHDAISKFEAKLRQIESNIAERESRSKRPFTFLKPSRLPHYIWI